MIGSWLKRQANTKVPSHFSTQGVAVPKSVSKKVVSTQVSLELNPLNATMRSAMRSGLLAKSLRKTAPLMVVSAAVVGSAVWVPESQAQEAATVSSTTITAPANATAAINVTALPSSDPTVGTTNVTNVTVSNIKLIEIQNNSTYHSNGTVDQAKTHVDFLNAPATGWGSASLTQLQNFETTFNLSDLGYSDVVVIMGGSGGSDNGTATVNTSGIIYNGLSATSFAAGSDSLTIKNDGTIFDGSASNNNSIYISGDGALGRLAITNNNLIQVNSTENNPQGSAINASLVGQVSIVNSQASDSIFGTYAGILVHNVGSASLLDGVLTSQPTVNITNNGTIEGDVGIYIINVTQSAGQPKTGDVVITNNEGGEIIGNKGVGISIVNVDDGVRISNSGNITGSGNSYLFSASGTPYAIGEVDNLYGAGIAIHNADVNSTGGSDFVTITNTNTGRIVGDRTTTASNGFYGVYAESLGDITVVNNGTIQGDGASAIYLRSQGGIANSSDINVTIQSGGVVQDELWTTASNLSLQQTAAIQGVIDINTEAGTATLTIDQGGSLYGAVRMGALDVASLTNDGNWSIFGDSAFTADAPTVNVTNTGTIKVLGSATLSNIDNFKNAGGVLDLTQDGGALNTTLTINTGAFVGAVASGNNADSFIYVNANLAGTVSSNVPVSVDNVNITGTGTASGITKIRITDANPSLPGSNSPIGAEVVRVADSSSPIGSFVLEQGPINKGLWQYDLFSEIVAGEDDDRDSVWRLASTPSEHAHELPVLQSAAQEAWHQSAAAWLDHTNNIRMRLEGGNAVKGGAWARVVGADVKRTNTNRYTQPASPYGNTISQQNDYNQDIYGVMFGADGAIDLANGGTWLLGLTGGVVQSKVGFTTSTTTMDYTAGSVGAYASYVQGGGFFNALLKGDIGSTDYKMSNGEGISANESFKTNAIGLMLDGGYRFRSGIAFIEPSLSVAAVNTNVKDKEFLATKVDFSNGNSLRTKLTLATGFSGSIGGTRWEPSLSLSAVNESGGENDVNLTSGGQDPVKVQDRQVKTYGQVGLGLKVIGAKGSSGFLMVEHVPSRSDNDATKGDAKRESTTVSAGVKVTW